MKTPFFGPFDVARYTNLADNQLINLRPTLVETRDGKAVGGLLGTAGLTLLSTVGAGPIQGMHEIINQTLYVVSGTNVYSITTGSWAGTLAGAITESGAQVSIIDNGSQFVIFGQMAAWAGPAGHPLQSAGINAAGFNYAINDTVVLTPNDGTQTAAAIITISNVGGGGAVTAFTVLQSGAFGTNPTGFSQKNTTGSGSGLTLNAPVYGAANALCSVALPFVGTTLTISATYQDGFGLIVQPGSNKIWQSLINDISVWPALNFGTASGESDNCTAIMSIHRLLFVIKQRTTEIWSNAGASPFAFQQISSVLIEGGTLAWNTVQKLDDALIFLSWNEQGYAQVIEMDGFKPRRISTHAVETMLGGAGTLATAFAFAYQQDGHSYYVLTIPNGNFTFVYDRTVSNQARMSIWHQWLAWSGAAFSRHVGNAYSFFNGTSVLGDFQNGNLYQIDLAALTDNGAARKWTRSWRALQEPTMQPVRFSSLQIDMQTGVSVTGSPNVSLDWSDDGGNTFSTPLTASVGASGAYAQRVKFNRLGSTRRNSGLDRIFRLSSADQFAVSLIGAELDV